jgi:hypothetical protein
VSAEREPYAAPRVGTVPRTAWTAEIRAAVADANGKANGRMNEAAPVGTNARPAVVMRPGKLNEVVAQAQDALLAAGASVYQRGDSLVCPVRMEDLRVRWQQDRKRADEPEHALVGGVKRFRGSTVLRSLNETRLTMMMGASADWYSLRRKEGELVRVVADPRSLYARSLLSDAGNWRFPVLRGLLTAPTLDANGGIVQRPGYDPTTCLLLDFLPGAFAPIPERPTKDQALVALARLERPVREMPFIDDRARSVALSAMLTALIRPSLPTAPLHGFDSPTAGSGKTKLAAMVGLLAMGSHPPAMSQGKSEEEDEKRLSTVLHAGDAVIQLDNCDREVSGDFLCMLLTSETVQARILGLSERRILPSTALVIATGNNLTFAGDMSRRAVVCRLDAKVERPDEREFDWEPCAETLRDRAELVVAGMTVLRAYIVAGQPERLKPMGSFEEWGWIRSALVWLGRADPAATRDAVLGSDPRKEALRGLMELWAHVFGTRCVTVADIAAREAPGAHELRQAFEDEACSGRDFNAKRVGRWLLRNRDRVVGGRSFRQAGKDPHTKVQTWALQEAQAAIPGVKA